MEIHSKTTMNSFHGNTCDYNDDCIPVDTYTKTTMNCIQGHIQITTTMIRIHGDTLGYNYKIHMVSQILI